MFEKSDHRNRQSQGLKIHLLDWSFGGGGWISAGTRSDEWTVFFLRNLQAYAALYCVGVPCLVVSAVAIARMELIEIKED